MAWIDECQLVAPYALTSRVFSFDLSNHVELTLYFRNILSVSQDISIRHLVRHNLSPRVSSGENRNENAVVDNWSLTEG